MDTHSKMLEIGALREKVGELFDVFRLCVRHLSIVRSSTFGALSMYDAVWSP